MAWKDRNGGALGVRLLASLLALSTGCASVKPAGSESMRLEVTGKEERWSAKLGGEELGQHELFRASGYDAIADELDDNRRWAWGSLGVALVMGAAAIGFGYGFAKSRESGEPSSPLMLGAIFTGVWALSGGIVASTRFGARRPGAETASAAAASHNARLDLRGMGITVPPPTEKDHPDSRAKLEGWMLAFHQATGAKKVELALEGWKRKEQLEKLGIDKAALALQIDEAFAKGGDDAATLRDRARFALQSQDREVLRRADEALTAQAPAREDAELWVALGDVRQARGEKKTALEAYAAAVQVAPLSLAALKPYGRALARDGRRREAVELWSKALLASDSDAERFELLDAISSIDRAWLHANAPNLPAGLVPAYRDHQAQRAQQRRLWGCLSRCGGIEWASLRQACEADCYALSGP